MLSEVKHLSGKTLRGVYPERKAEILRYAQNDSTRKAQSDKNRFVMLSEAKHLSVSAATLMGSDQLRS